jgi:hypothetical protein
LIGLEVPHVRFFTISRPAVFAPQGLLSRLHGRRYRRRVGPDALWSKRMGRFLPSPVAVRQEGALHPWRELHRLMLLGGLCQERDPGVGDPGHRLPGLRIRLSRPRTPGVPPGRDLFVVYLQSGASQASAHTIQPGGSVAQCPEAAYRSGGRLAEHCGKSRSAPSLPEGSRQRRVRTGGLGGGRRACRRLAGAHHQEIWSGPHLRIFPHPGHVHGQLRIRLQ